MVKLVLSIAPLSRVDGGCRVRYLMDVPVRDTRLRQPPVGFPRACRGHTRKTTVIITIEAPHFSAAVTLHDGYVVRAAYPLHFIKGWPARKLAFFCTKKHWNVSPNVILTPTPTST